MLWLFFKKYFFAFASLCAQLFVTLQPDKEKVFF